MQMELSGDRFLEEGWEDRGRFLFVVERRLQPVVILVIELVRKATSGQSFTEIQSCYCSRYARDTGRTHSVGVSELFFIKRHRHKVRSLMVANNAYRQHQH